MRFIDTKVSLNLYRPYEVVTGVTVYFLYDMDNFRCSIFILRYNL